MADTALAVQTQDPFSAEQRKMIRDSLANGASPEEFAMLMEVARARNLNPITRQIHFVKRYDGQKQREVWSYQVAIDGLRAIAERTGRYDGQDEPEFEHDTKGGLKLSKVRVYKKGIQRPFVGVAYWSEYVQTKKDGSVTKMWSEKPHIMLAKCAEALALRKAFPEDTSGLYTDEEVPQRPEREINAAPVRGVVTDDPEPPYDPVTGEVLEGGSPPAAPAPAGGRLGDELKATALVGRIGQFKNHFEAEKWLKKHWDEIGELNKHPDLHAQVKATYEAAHARHKAAYVAAHPEQNGAPQEVA